MICGSAEPAPAKAGVEELFLDQALHRTGTDPAEAGQVVLEQLFPRDRLLAPLFELGEQLMHLQFHDTPSIALARRTEHD
jgi:hypothetical protein